MGTTSVKNLLQYEVLPSTTVTPTTGSQLVTQVSTEGFGPQFSGISYTGTISIISLFTYFINQRPFINGAFTTTTRTAVWNTISEANLLTLDLGTIENINPFNLSTPALTSLSAPSLKYVTNTVNITATSLITASFASLSVVLGDFFIVSSPVLTTLNIPQLAYISNFSVVANNLTTISLPAIVNIAGGLACTTPNLTTFTLGSTLKVVGANFGITTAKLTQASVDNILVRLAALDGTNGTTAYSSKVVSLNGGTSSAPSATGLAAKTTLQGRGCTVTTN